MALQLDVLYVHDARGRITARRDAQRSGAPRFHLGRTRHGNLWRLREDLRPAVARRLSRLAGREAPLGPVPQPPRGPAAPERLEAMREALQASAPITVAWAGPAFRFPDDGAASDRLGDLASGAEPLALHDGEIAAAVAASFPQLAPSLSRRSPCFGVREAGRIVSVAYLATGEGSVGREVGVDTLPGHRRRGHGARCVAAWALAVREAGGIPLYSTSWDNRASRALARKLGLELYGEDVHLT